MLRIVAVKYRFLHRDSQCMASVYLYIGVIPITPTRKGLHVYALL